MATLFWALWDESFGQRPWKAFQQEWKQRYSAFLNNARLEVSTSQQKKSKNNSAVPATGASLSSKPTQTAKPRRDELQKQITDLSAKILAVQNVFTDKRAYVNALTYQIETETSASGKKSKQEDIDEYKKKKADRRISRRPQAAIQLPATGRDIQRTQRRAHQAERRTGRRAEAGDRGQHQDVRLSSPSTWWTSRLRRSTA